MGSSSARLPSPPPPTPDPAPPPPTAFSSCDQEGALRDGGPQAPRALATVERLTQATGGTERSWYRCVFPFGLISLVMGGAGTGVAFSFDTGRQTKAVSLVLLGVGVAMVLLAAACWRLHRLKRRRRRKEGGSFSSEQCAL